MIETTYEHQNLDPITQITEIESDEEEMESNKESNKELNPEDIQKFIESSAEFTSPSKGNEVEFLPTPEPTSSSSNVTKPTSS